MALPRFQFTGSWENPADFPTHEYSEVQVRKDMMRLFTEIETYLNRTLIPQLEAGSSGGSGSGVSGDYLPLAGGQMSGPLLLYDNPAYPMESATKQYVDDTGGLIQRGVDDAIAAITVDLNRIQATVSDGLGNVSQLTMTPDEIQALIQNALGDLAAVTLNADQIRALVQNALGDEAQLTMTAEEIEAFVTNKLGDISRLIMSADEIRALVESAAGSSSSLTMTPEEIEALVRDNLNNFSRILQTSTAIRQAVEDSLGNASELSLTAEEVRALVSDMLGRSAEMVLTADEIKAIVRDQFNAEAMLEILSDRIALLVQDAAQEAGVNITAEDVQIMVRDAVAQAQLTVDTSAIEARIQDNADNIAALSLSAEGIEARVSDAEGNVSALQQTAQALSATVADHSNNLASLQLTAQGLTTTVQNQAGDISTLQQTADSLTSRVENSEGSLSTLRQTAEDISSTVSSLDGRTTRIQQNLDSISLSASNYTENGEVYARLTLSIGPNNYVGRIRMEGNVDISGELSAAALYAARGEVADLSVDKLTTSRRIVKYLDHDTSDDTYLRLRDQYLDFVAGIYEEGSPVHAATPDGIPLYWEADVSNAGRAADGYPAVEGVRIFTTTTVTQWPVYTYRYTEQVKLSIRFVQGSNGIYNPVAIFGAGNAQGYNQGFIEKDTEGFYFRYVTPTGKVTGIRMTTDGFVDITGQRRTAALNFSGWDGGAFSQVLEGGRTNTYSVTFSGTGDPISISDPSSGYAMSIQW